MLEILPDFNEYYERKLVQTRNFLDAQDVAEADYAVIGFDSTAPASAKLVMRYGEEMFEAGGLLADISIPGRQGMNAKMEFSLGTMVLSYLMENSARLKEARELGVDLPLDEAASELSVDVQSIWQEPGDPLVREGHLLSYRSDQDDYVLGFHERGDAFVRISSGSPAMIALCYKSLLGIDDTQLPSRRGPYMPAQ
ncbi:MAG: hypothetical protein AAFQ27_09785 [Pseudomonadota bacterium]